MCNGSGCPGSAPLEKSGRTAGCIFLPFPLNTSVPAIPPIWSVEPFGKMMSVQMTSRPAKSTVKNSEAADIRSTTRLGTQSALTHCCRNSIGKGRASGTARKYRMVTLEKPPNPSWPVVVNLTFLPMFVLNLTFVCRCQVLDTHHRPRATRKAWPSESFPRRSNHKPAGIENRCSEEGTPIRTHFAPIQAYPETVDGPGVQLEVVLNYKSRICSASASAPAAVHIQIGALDPKVWPIALERPFEERSSPCPRSLRTAVR